MIEKIIINDNVSVEIVSTHDGEIEKLVINNDGTVSETFSWCDDNYTVEKIVELAEFTAQRVKQIKLLNVKKGQISRFEINNFLNIYLFIKFQEVEKMGVIDKDDTLEDMQETVDSICECFLN